MQSGLALQMTLPAEIETRLATIEALIEKACRRSGRARGEVTLVGASKVQSVASILAAHRAGLQVFGENRVQEAEGKAPELPSTLDWHLIGPLQSNKVRRAVAIFSTIHSIDRLKIARAIDRVAAETGVVRRALLEVNVGGEASKHGFAPAALGEPALTDLAELSHLRIIGLMAIPPHAAQPEDARQWFRRLRELGERVGETGILPHWAGALSMGMSHDFEVAIEEGATHVRLGTRLFGARPPLVRGA